VSGGTTLPPLTHLLPLHRLGAAAVPLHMAQVLVCEPQQGFLHDVWVGSSERDCTCWSLCVPGGPRVEHPPTHPPTTMSCHETTHSLCCSCFFCWNEFDFVKSSWGVGLADTHPTQSIAFNFQPHGARTPRAGCATKRPNTFVCTRLLGGTTTHEPPTHEHSSSSSSM
jgi:hypothetical protein